MFNKCFRMNKEINYLTFEIKVHCKKLLEEKERARRGRESKRKKRGGEKSKEEEERKKEGRKRKKGKKGRRGKWGMKARKIFWLWNRKHGHTSPCSSFQNAIIPPDNYLTDHEKRTLKA